jgi:hypothetical protein
MIAGRELVHFMRFHLKPKSFLDPSRRDWQFDAFGWLLRNSGGYPKFLESALILPTEEYFPDRGMKGHAAVAALFRRAREHAGMEDWPCTVEAAGGEPRPANDTPDRVLVITYERGTLDPIALIAHFARELGRYLLTSITEPVPGGEAAQERMVELAAVFMGFGLFMANSAASRASYQLSEGEMAHALAIFCLLGKNPPESADKHLNPHLRKHVRLAARDLAQYETRFQHLRTMPATAGIEIPERTLPTQAG